MTDPSGQGAAAPTFQPPPPPPPWQPPPSVPPTPPPGFYQVRGVVGRPTRPFKQILLTIITLGIWGVVWTYRQHQDIKAWSGDGVGGALGAVIVVLVGIVTPFLLASEVESKLFGREGKVSPVRTITGLWVLIPLLGSLIWYVKVQNALNDFWISHGAAEP